MNREKEIIKTSFVGIIGNALLVGFKAFVGILAGSIAIIMDAINNLTDALSSIITIVGAKLANKRPNKKHPYGYGRIEYVASTLIAMLILFAGGMAIYESIKSIIDYFQNGTMPEFEIYSMIIIVGAIIVKVAIGIYFRYKGKKIDSDSLKASGMDALFDAGLTTATLVGIIVAKYANVYIEGYLGILIGLFILKTGFEVLKDSLSSVIGNRFDKEFIRDIKKDIASVPGVKGVYDLILNNYGHDRNIGSVHVAVDENISVRDIQILERKIVYIMYEKYNTIMTVGVYAENFKDPETKALFTKVSEVLKNYPQVLQIHGFYIDKEQNLLSFDLVISFDDDKPLETIEEIKNHVKEFTQYEILINYDQDFTLS